MVEDPTKKQQAPGAAQQASGPTVNSAPEPTWDISAYDHPTDDTTDTPSDATPEQPHPVASWWDRLTNTVGETAKAIPRGALNAIEETQKSVAENATALGHPELAAAGDLGSKITDKVKSYLGKRSDDAVANFAESTTQFLTGMAATGGFGEGMVANLAKGAAVDMAAFDPREAQLAELAARAPVPGLQQLGQFLSVKDDDSQLTARLKRAAAGVLTSTAMEGVLAGIKSIRAGRVLADAAATPAEKATAQATVDESQKVVQSVADGTYKSPDDPFVVEKSPEGDQWQVSPNPDNVAAKGLGMLDGEGPREITFPDRAAAEAQAATAGFSANQRYIAQNAGNVINKVDEFTSNLTTMLKDNDGDGIRALMDDSDHFNVSYFTKPNDALAAIQTTSDVWQKAIDAAQARGAEDVPTLIGRAKAVLGSLDDTSAPRYFGTKLGQQQGQAVTNLAADTYMRILGSKVANLASLYEARKGDPVLLKDASEAIGNMFGLQKQLAGANSEAGRTMRMMQERGNTLLDDAKLKDPQAAAAVDGSPATPSPAAASADETAKLVAGMDTRTIEKVLKAVRIADGNVTNLYAVGFAARKEVSPGLGSKFMEIFANGLLSRPVTAATQLVSGASVSAFESLGRILAGVASGNSALAREGADMAYSHFKYLDDNIASMWAAIKSGGSVINPQVQHVAWDNAFGDFVRTPTKVIIGMDEFTKTANYRAKIRSASLRLGRQAGLSGDALDQYVENDLKSAFDGPTGIGLVPSALKFGETASMSAPLESAFGRKYQELMQTSTLARVITPFVKAPINMFNYAWSVTPGLNLFNRQSRAILQAGGEDAAILKAKTSIAGSLYSWGAYQALNGNLTGRGPSDPKLRKEWLADNQPYSVKVGGKWVSYRRSDPIGMPLGLIADGVSMSQEMEHGGDASVSDMAIASIAALTSAVSNRTYLQGITEAAKAWSSGDQYSLKQWLDNFGGNVVVPGVADAVNPDPYLREVQSMGDAIMSRIPGYSEKLDPRFDIWGQPVLKNSAFQRGFNPYAVSDVKHTNDQLLAIGKGYPTPPTQEFNGQIDLSDKSWDTQKVGKSPYARWMELVSQSGLKSDATDMMSSPEWKDLSNGTDQYKGGEQYLRMAGLIERHYSAARRQMESEYPKLADQIRMLNRTKGAAVRGGDAGVAAVQQMFGK